MDVSVDGQSITPHLRRQSLWLLALLAAQHDGEVTRELVADRFWPDSDSDTAGQNLRKCLSRLRHELGDAADCIVVTAHRRLGLEVVGADIDVVAFDRAIAAGDPDSLRVAVKLYRGHYLEGCEEHWAVAERAVRREAVLKALDGLAAEARSLGEPDLETGYRRRAVGLAPLWEPAVEDLMRCLLLNGDKTGVVEEYKGFERRLRDADPMRRPSRAIVELFQTTRKSGCAPLVLTDHAHLPAESQHTPSVLNLRPKPYSPLPKPLTELVGREKDISDLLLALDRKRLVTLTGIGGVGKTRLAIAVGERIAAEPRTVVFVDFASVAESNLVPATVAMALGLSEDAGALFTDIILGDLREADLLLILDNCEHVVSGVADITSGILLGCAGVHILATSREPLLITGERNRPVEPLDTPEDVLGKPQEAMSVSSVRLFVERAIDATSNFQLNGDTLGPVAAICRCLDGIPLALELAAVTLSTMTVGGLADAMNRRYEILTCGSRTALPRHQTLGAMLDWSHDLLTPPQQILFRRLSVFNGGWTVSAATQVCGDRGETDCALPQANVRQVLDELVHKSLVVFNEHYSLLETTREYARTRAHAAGEVDLLCRRHFEFYCQVFSSQPERSPEIATELGNLRSALDWIVSGTEDSRGAVSLCAAFGSVPDGVTLFREARLRTEVLLCRPELQDANKDRARALHVCGGYALKQGEAEVAHKYLREAFDIAQKMDIGSGYRILGGIAEADWMVGDLAAAQECLNESIRMAQANGDLYTMGESRRKLGSFLMDDGQLDCVEDLLLVAMADLQECNHPNWKLALVNLAALAFRRGEYQCARDRVNSVLHSPRPAAEPTWLHDCLEVLARVALAECRPRRAAVLFGAMVETIARLGLTRYWDRDFISADEWASRNGVDPALFDDVSAKRSPEEWWIRSRLTEEAFETALAEGRRMDRDSLLEYITEWNKT